MLGRTSDPLIANSTNSYHMEDGEWNMDVEKALEITLNIGVIAFVEMTIKWNNITNVHSLREPGQFMPLLIALAQLLAVLYQGLSRFVAIAAADDDTDDGCKSLRRVARARSDGELMIVQMPVAMPIVFMIKKRVCRLR